MVSPIQLEQPELAMSLQDRRSIFLDLSRADLLLHVRSMVKAFDEMGYDLRLENMVLHIHPQGYTT